MHGHIGTTVDNGVGGPQRIVSLPADECHERIPVAPSAVRRSVASQWLPAL